MIEGLSDTNMMRIGIGLAALIVFLVILYSSRNRPGQGRRVAAPAGDASERVEPTLREAIEAGDDAADQKLAIDELASDADAPVLRPPATVGSRPAGEYDKIVSIFLVARAGQSLLGPDLVVAAEKAGLVYGHMNIFHRMVDQHPELGPIFSVANLVKPGYFDLRGIKELQTPGVNFFITLPGPMSALDAWDTLLPTAQRMAELLDAVLLDEERNALGRQRIANIRDEMRAYDRAREKMNIRPGR
ncbi:MAG: cell division protein ZipA [Frankiaceae bacterium]|nr:cell division protein ZipA [Arenimonas sp.]